MLSMPNKTRKMISNDKIVFKFFYNYEDHIVQFEVA